VRPRRCIECGRSLALANVKRARAGLRRLDLSRARTCGRAPCVRAWLRHRFRYHSAREPHRIVQRRCSECGRSMKEASAARVRAGLPRLAAAAKTCGRAACVLSRETRLMREWWAKRPRLVAKALPPERWRCAECGANRRTADRKRARAGLPPLDVERRRNVTCGPRCYQARELRRYILRIGHAPRARRREVIHACQPAWYASVARERA
jgi:uncharacterized protein with PIN domain